MSILLRISNMAIYVKPSTKIEVAKKTNNRCAFCGEKLSERLGISYIVRPERFKTLMLKHKENKGFEIPEYLEHLNEFDGTHIDNMLACCHSCSRQKKDNGLEEYREIITQTVATLNRYITQYQLAKRFGLIEESNIEIFEFYFETIDIYNTKRKKAV